jgi:hypothetical protein
MIVKIRIPRSFFPSSRGHLAALAAAPLPTGGSFHTALSDVAGDWAMQGAPRAGGFVSRPSVREAEPGAGSPLARAWTWLHAKYAQSATKRLRVAETVSLGEKRFVALISVEGREFLIGGGTSGVSLLAQLGTQETANAARAASSGERGSN